MADTQQAKDVEERRSPTLIRQCVRVPLFIHEYSLCRLKHFTLSELGLYGAPLYSSQEIIIVGVVVLTVAKLTFCTLSRFSLHSTAAWYPPLRQLNFRLSLQLK